MARFRVLRVIEYTYQSTDAMVEDMTRWNAPVDGSRVEPNVTLRSSIVTFEPIFSNPEETSQV